MRTCLNRKHLFRFSSLPFLLAPLPPYHTHLPSLSLPLTPPSRDFITKRNWHGKTSFSLLLYFLYCVYFPQRILLDFPSVTYLLHWLPCHFYCCVIATTITSPLNSTPGRFSSYLSLLTFQLPRSTLPDFPSINIYSQASLPFLPFIEQQHQYLFHTPLSSKFQ